jgi:hypothetical protein
MIKLKDIINETASKEAMGIAGFTGTRGITVQKFIDDFNLNAKKLFNFIAKGKLKDRMDFATAISGNPGNKYQGNFVGMFGESVVSEVTLQKGKTYGGTKCEGGCFMGKEGLKKIIKISKDSPKDVFMFRDDNYSGLQPHFVKDGVIAKATVLNPAYDLEKHKVRSLNIGKDVILSVRLFVSTNESITEATLTEKKYYVTYNKGRGQGKGLEKEFDQKSFKTTDKPKVFNSFNDAKKYAEKMEKMFQHSIGGGTAYWVSDEKMNQIKESVNEESYKVAGRPVTLIKGKKSDATDWKVKFQNGKETSLSDVLALIKPFPKGVHWRYKNLESVNESDLKGYLVADVVDDIVKSIGSKFVSGEIKNAPNKNYIYLKLTDIKFGNDVVKMLKSKFGIDAKIDKTFGNIPSVSFASKKVVSEAKSDYAVYHKTYTSAIQSAREYAEKKGYEIDDDDAFRQIGMGPKKPSDGKTNRFSIQLTKDGKPQKKHLHIQVYGMGTYKRNPDGSKTRSMWGGQNEYELNAYIN